MTGIWLILWFVNSQPDVHGGWMFGLVIAALWDLL